MTLNSCFLYENCRRAREVKEKSESSKLFLAFLNTVIVRIRLTYLSFVIDRHMYIYRTAKREQ